MGILAIFCVPTEFVGKLTRCCSHKDKNREELLPSCKPSMRREELSTTFDFMYQPFGLMGSTMFINTLNSRSSRPGLQTGHRASAESKRATSKQLAKASKPAMDRLLFDVLYIRACLFEIGLSFSFASCLRPLFLSGLYAPFQVLHC